MGVKVGRISPLELAVLVEEVVPLSELLLVLCAKAETPAAAAGTRCPFVASRGRTKAAATAEPPGTGVRGGTSKSHRRCNHDEKCQRLHWCVSP